MDKKGLTWLGELVLGIVFVIVILSILLGPKQLYAQGRDAVFNFGSSFGQKEGFPQYSGDARVPQDLANHFDGLVSKLRNAGDGENCLIEMSDTGEMPKLGGFSIVLYNDKIELQKKSSRGLTPPEKSEYIEGFKPCSIRGTKAKRFYYCMANGYKCNDVHIEEQNVIISDDIKIAPFLFKVNNNHICLTYLDGIDFTGGCNEVENLIDDACVERIKRTYSDCSASALPKRQIDDECIAISYCYNELQIINARPDSPCLPSTPTAFFQTKEDCIRGSLCVKEHTNKMPTIKICDDSNEDTLFKIWIWPRYRR